MFGVIQIASLNTAASTYLMICLGFMVTVLWASSAANQKLWGGRWLANTLVALGVGASTLVRIGGIFGQPYCSPTGNLALGFDLMASVGIILTLFV